MWIPFTLKGPGGFCFVGILGPCSAIADSITAKAAAFGLIGNTDQEKGGKRPENLASLGAILLIFRPKKEKNSLRAISVYI